MPACAFHGCTNYTRKTKGTDIRYFSFPKDKEMKSRWINACKRLDSFNVANGAVCSEHFKESDFEVSLKHRLLNYLPKNVRTLKAHAVPFADPCENNKTMVNGRIYKRHRRSRSVGNEALLERLELAPQVFKMVMEPLMELHEAPESQAESDPNQTEVIKALNVEICQWKRKFKEVSHKNLVLENELEESQIKKVKQFLPL